MKQSILYISILLVFSFSVVKAQSCSGQIIVQLNAGTSPRLIQNKFNELHNTCQISIAEELSDAMNIWLYSVNYNSLSEINVTDELYKISEVIAVQHNYKITFRNAIPNDPYFTSQWNLRNDGNSGGITDADIDADLAWEYGIGDTTLNGTKIVIAMVDGGFDLLHKDLSFWKNELEIPNDLIDNDNNGYVDDYGGWNIESGSGNANTPGLYNGHATAASGAAAAIGNNNIGIAGVAYGAKILPIHLGTVHIDSVVKAYNYVIKMRQLYNSSKGDSGAFIVAVNSSFGLEDSPDSNSVWCNMYDFMGNIGIVSTLAAPNEFKDFDINDDVPGNCASLYTINTTNSTNKDEIENAGFGKKNVDIAAPATGILITKPFSEYATGTGTSFAAPQVAGAIAVLYSVACDSILKLCQSNPNQIALLMKDFILKNVDVKSSFQDKLSSNGRLNLFNSLTAVQNYCGGTIHSPSIGSKLLLYWTSYNNESDNLIINYDFPKSADALFCIYDLTGKKVLEFNTEKLSEGNYTTLFPSNLSSGFYFIRLSENNNFSNTLKFVVE